MPEEIGVAASIGVIQFTGTMIDSQINGWFKENPDVEVIDIKFATSADEQEWMSDALIIYRKEV